MSLMQKLFGGGSASAEVKEMIENGAVVLDVRSPMEFKSGHVAGSKNIPLQNIPNRMKDIEKIKQPLVVVCASGNRSGQAVQFLKSRGIECVNGGAWRAVSNS